MNAIRIGCICNPDAARNRKLLPKLRPLLSKLANHTYIETTSSKDYGEILSAGLVESLDLLILSGGDGTLQQGMSALLACGASRFPKLVLLPAGSTNVAAADISGRLGLAESVRALAEQLPNLVTRSRRPLMIRAVKSEAPLAGFFFGVGAAPAAVARYRRVRRPVRGLPVLDAGASLVAIGGTILEIGIQGEDWPQVTFGEMRVDGESTGIQRTSLALLTCLDGLFMGASPWWGQGDAPMRYLQIGLGAPSLLKNLPGILRGVPGEGVRCSAHYASGGATRIDFPEISAFTIDGELFRLRRAPAALKVEAGPELEFVRLV